MTKVDRVVTGVPGLDQLLHGGIPRNQLVLLTGTAGTGKTILCCQYIHNGLIGKEPGVYLTLEEPAAYIRETARSFGWDFDRYENEGKFTFVAYDPYRAEDLAEILESTIRRTHAKRVVIDSISALGLHFRDPEELRRMIFTLSTTLRRLDCTSMMVSEIVHGKLGLSRYGVEEFVSDSVIAMYYERIQSVFNRSIQIWKLRGSTHSEKLHPYEITQKGISVNENDEAYSRSMR